jgi:cellulose synthase/poly-beta-1,6-N-acetylglucosamine synthase-like glycosyltransferase
LKWPDLEVVVVDDESADRTAEIVVTFANDNPALKIKLIKGKPRPNGWTGKNWACHQAFEAASGDWLLFTDADTEHASASLERAVTRMREENLDLLTATPFHRCETLWEKLLGPFQVFMFIATAAFSKPRPGRVFAIGQYLLFRRAAYLKQGGHERIRDVLCDDLELAHHCLKSGGTYAVEGGGEPLFRVRMYGSFLDFVRGWRRIFRLGFRHAKVSSSIEMYFVVAALTGSMKFFSAGWILSAVMVSSAVFLGIAQKRFGEFSWVGVVLLPFSLTIFVVISLLSVWDLATNQAYEWRGRSYSDTAD